MADPVIQQIVNNLAGRLAALTSTLVGDAVLFNAVVQPGATIDEIDRSQPPLAAIVLGRDSSTQRSVGPDGQAKMTSSLPVTVQVKFPRSLVPSGKTVVHAASVLLSEIIAEVHDDRTCGGPAQDIVYTGGGMQLITESDGLDPSEFAIAPEFQLTFRYDSIDPTQN